MKTTFNRRLILSVLAESIDGTPPPHSAGSVFYRLENAFEYKWDCGLYVQMKTLPNMRQIHRTLKDLWHAGLIVGSREKHDPMTPNSLPGWVVSYQLSGDVYRNDLVAQCNDVYQQVDKAKHGVKFFDAVFDMGLPASEVSTLALRVKVLLEKTQADGFEHEFQRMQQCAAWIESGIPKPKPTAVDRPKSIVKSENPVLVESHVPYDGSGKLGEAIAGLCGLSPKSSAMVARRINEAKSGLGITTKSKNLPNDVKLAIYQWHHARLNPTDKHTIYLSER